MEFKYLPYDGQQLRVYIPRIPITLVGGAAFKVGFALVDTGADMTLLPMEMKKWMKTEIDEEHPIDISSAGGGDFKAFPSLEPIEYRIEQEGFRTITWKGTAFFAPRQSIVLLGHHQCLDQLNLTFKGKQKKLIVEKA